MRTVPIPGARVPLADVVAVARGKAPVDLTKAARDRIARSRRSVEALLGRGRPEYGVTTGEKLGRQKFLIEEMTEEPRVAYGITTGFGELARVSIPPDELRDLQRNLLLSHAAGVGEPLPEDVVRAMIYLRANALAAGLSGIRVEVVELLVSLLNAGVVPVVPSKGSLGASGDLVPLAHAALVLIGEGEAKVGGERVPGAEALRRAGLAPVTLEAKEGLALINGTQLMSAVLALAVHDGWSLVRHAEVAGAMSVEALLGSERPFDARVHAARPHPGQVASASNLRSLVADSGIIESHADCDRVQDAYSLRCLPQVLGAVRTALAHAEEVLEIEFGSATDNPLVFEDGDAVSAGNFHGEPLALVAAYLAAALAEVAAMSERRVARLLDPRLSEGLPPFLAERSGLNSGYMIPQYVAAALVLENQVLCHPAVLGNLPTSANQEDFNSNGAVGAIKAAEVLRNAERVVGIELLSAAQALDFRLPLRAGRGCEAARRAVREAIPHLGADRLLSPEVHAVVTLLREGAVLRAVEDATGPLL